MTDIAGVVAKIAAHMQLQRVLRQAEGEKNPLFFGEDFAKSLFALLCGDGALA